MLQQKEIQEERYIENQAEDIYQIFDKVFKKIITLSCVAVINLINALFHTDYPTDSTITYNWTEFENEKLKRILADTILTINGMYSYHIEAQIEKDNAIVFRVFEYGFYHANRTRYTEDGKYVLPFPTPVVIYLYYENQVPEEYSLVLEFNRDGSAEGEEKQTFEYKVPVIKLQDISAQELNDRKMVILIPFHLLKLRKAVKDGNLEKRMDELKTMITDDIIGSIDKNQELGNITPEDAYRLKCYVESMWKYLCKHHKELEAFSDMTDESFMTVADVICEDLERTREALKNKEKMLEEKDKVLEENAREIERLRAENERLKAMKR